MIGSKLRQIAFAARNPRATVGYPLAPRAPEPGFRGRVVVDTARCVGCAGCADVCPARCILVTDLDATTRVMRRRLDRCLLCGRCEDACVYGAVWLEGDWETGTPDRADLDIVQTLFMAACDRCGRCYDPVHPLDHPAARGMRADEPWRLAPPAAGDRGRDGGDRVAGQGRPAPETGAAPAPAAGNGSAGSAAVAVVTSTAAPTRARGAKE